MPSITALNEAFAIPDHITFFEGRNSMTAIRLRSEAGQVEVYLNGAHITHWHPTGEDPVLWLSDRSYFDEGQPIRGGVPICWPWFGTHDSDPDKPSHGIARTSQWTVAKTEKTDSDLSVTLTLTSDARSKAIFDGDFQLTYTITLSDTLTYALSTKNTGDAPFTISEALHTYFGVASVPQVSVHGLQDTLYIDKLKNARTFKQNGEIKFTEETDRVYIDTTASTVIKDPWAGREITIEKSGSLSTVVWNPWIDKSALMPDFGDFEYKTMVCVETANAHDNAHEIAPDEVKTMEVRLHVA